MLLYLIKVVLLHGLFLAVYQLILRGSGRHSMNRVYLLGTYLLAFSIPIVEINPFPAKPEVIVDMTVPLQYVEASDEIVYRITASASEGRGLWAPMVFLVFCGISGVLLLRALIGFIAIGLLTRKAVLVKKSWYRLYHIPDHDSYTFWRSIFLSKRIFGTDQYRDILEHECEHARKLHTIDRVLLDFGVSLFWFNPFIYLYRNALIEVHEYEADQAALTQTGDPILYQETLFKQLQSSRKPDYVSHFNFQLLKKRIVMMNRKKTANPLIYFVVVPILIFAVMAFSDRSTNSVDMPEYLQDASIIGPLEDFELDADWHYLQDFTPSIVPLKVDEEVEVTSTFGWRADPTDGKKRWHRGIDFRCRLGTPVIAPADGEVVMVQDNPGGFGKAVKLAHGDQFETFYAHLDGYDVTEGEKVRKGQVIAYTGNSGLSKGPHLHYEVVKDGKHVNPELYMNNLNHKSANKIEKKGVLESRSDENSGDSTLTQKEQDFLKEEAEALERAEMLRVWGEKMIDLEEEQRQYQENLRLKKQALLDKQMALTFKQQAMLERERALELRQRAIIEFQQALQLQQKEVIEQQKALEIQNKTLLEKEKQKQKQEE